MSTTRPSHRVMRWAALALVGVGAIIAILLIVANIAFNTDRVAPGTVNAYAVSKDGTRIVYELTGQGPPVVLVAAALADRTGARRLATHLAQHFTVINYDRRGRGDSGDTQPYAVDREIEDIEALIDAHGGHASLFGSSSGSVLALDAAARLDSKVERLFLYEPPLIIDGSHPPVPDDLARELAELTSAGRNNDAVSLFFVRAMGIPGGAVRVMRWVMPGWSKMAAMAHTLRYDLTVLAGTQSGKPLPAARWAANSAPTLVMVGSRSEPFFHSGARSLAAILPNGKYRSLEGCDHSAILFAAKDLAGAVSRFLLHERNTAGAQL